ncbi:MAG: tRNA preQ1(34) S-adenosylmethionine ribosyltransferase-isomerase QueA [Myxococcota bacterium]
MTSVDDARLATGERGEHAEAELETVLDAYDFALPERLVAQHPLPDREAARLLVVARETGRPIAPETAQHVRDLPRWLRPGDLLVVNATRVLPARLVGRKASGGLAEALLLGRDDAPEAPPGAYRALLRCTGRVRTGLRLVFERPGGSAAARALEAEVVERHARGEVTLVFAHAEADPYAIGLAPLPPYIRRMPDTAPESDLERYQTVFARAAGAVAAPTAGLHLTKPLLAALTERGVASAEVVLHVGIGTFRPLDVEAWRSGRLHRERFELPEETVDAIERTRARGGRVVAVGTTTTRVLESQAREDGTLVPGRGETDLFLRPGAKLRIVDGLLTNFHLPRSSLLMLVATMIGREAVLAAYHEAIGREFRFFSYGDAMLILPDAGAPHAG